MKDKPTRRKHADLPRYEVRLTINGQPLLVAVAARETLLDTLRRLEFTEVKDGCGSGQCGVCAVQIDGVPANSCLVLTVTCEGTDIRTAAGLGTVLAPSRLQSTMAAEGAVQCGFCMPAMVCAVDPLQRQPDVSEHDVREAMDGILCRCTGYVKPVRAISGCCGASDIPPPADTDRRHIVGRRVPKRDALSMVCGTALYCDDDVHTGALVLKAAASDKAHAVVRAIDASATWEIDGVMEVITCFEVAAEEPRGKGIFPDTAEGQNSLLTTHPRHVGDRIAAVIATNEEAAERGVRALRISYDDLPFVIDPKQAQRADAPLVDPEAEAISGARNVAATLAYEKGAPEPALESADIHIRVNVRTAPVQAAFAEPYACVTWLDENGRVVIRTSTQVPYFVRWVVSAVCDVPISAIRVVRPCIGGGFGAKQDVFVEPLCTLATLRTGKPVRYIFDRTEVFRTGRHRHPADITVEAGMRDGKVDALRMKVELNTGAYRSHGRAVLLSSASRPLPMYRWNHIRFEGRSVMTHLPPSGGLRGYGAPQSFFALESAIDELARAANIDPLQLRLDNAIQKGDSLEVIHALESGDEPCPLTLPPSSLHESMQLGAALIGWEQKRKRAPGRGRYRRGVGMAIAMQAPTSVHLMLSSATIKLDEDGSFTLLTGAADIGTGAETALAQIAAEVLSVPSTRVVVSSGNTDLAPFDSGAYSSSTTWNAGTATYRAAQDVKSLLLLTAARITGRFPETLQLVHGHVVSEDGAAKLPYREIAMNAIHKRLLRQIMASASHAPRSVPPSFSAQFAEVEVDSATGVIRVLDYVATVDCGTAINPTFVEGQMEGAVSMGLGAALSEELRFNDRGILLNADLSSYQLLRSMDMPPVRVEIVPSSPPGVPFGAKSVGEIGTMGPLPTIANAVAHATGVRLTEAPFTPWRVLEALDRVSPNAPV